MEQMSSPVSNELLGAGIALVSAIVSGGASAFLALKIHRRLSNEAARRDVYAQLVGGLSNLPLLFSQAPLGGLTGIETLREAALEVRRISGIARLYANRRMNVALDDMSEALNKFLADIAVGEDDTPATYAAKVAAAWKEHLETQHKAFRDAIRKQLGLGSG